MLRHLVGQFQFYRRRIYYGYIVAICSTVILLVAWGAYYSYGIFFVPLLSEFAWTRASVSGAFSLGTIIQGVAAIATGRLTDRFGARPVVTVGGIIAGTGYVLMSQIDSIWQLYIIYGVLIGIGTGCYFVSLVSHAAHWFQHRRGLMTGVVVSGIGLGAIIVPPLANRLISIYDWRSSYIIIGTTVVVVSVLLAQLLKRRVPMAHNIDSHPVPNQDIRSTKGFSLRAALRTYQLWMICALFLCLGFCLFSIMVHIVPHAMDRGFSMDESAAIIAIIGISSIVGKVGLGYLADRIGPRPGWIIGFAIMAIAVFYLLAADTLWALYAFAVAFGLAYGCLVAMESPIIADMFGLRAHGAILGLASFMFMVGAAIGPWQAGYTYDIMLSYRLTFIVLGAMAIIGIILAALLKPFAKQTGTVTGKLQSMTY